MKMNELHVGLGGGSLIQVANRSYIQMMSYIIDTPNGKTVIIDGGNNCREDGEHLHRLITERGGKVDLWLFTHAHDDHYGALLNILENTDKLDFEIEQMLFSFPDPEWFKNIENGEFYDPLVKFLNQLERHGIKHGPLHAGDTLECGGMTFDIVNNCDNYEDYQWVNDTSIVILAHFPKRDVLFLGDLAVQGGNYLLEHFDTAKIRCDIVQMAHHGQAGVDKAFYEVVQPKICLYAAPDWLWENDGGNGKDTGPWETLETRKWMEELKIQVSCPSAFGDYLLK